VIQRLIEGSGRRGNWRKRWNRDGDETELELEGRAGVVPVGSS